VYVIGGAAICLLNPARTTTNDIHGYIRHVDATETISALQRKWGLEADWFNWHAQGLQPPVAGEDMFTPYTSEGQVGLYLAKADALLAMKLFASRAKDQPDIDFLLALCEVDSVDQAEERSSTATTPARASAAGPSPASSIR
jgi:hypothetical protein